MPRTLVVLIAIVAMTRGVAAQPATPPLPDTPPAEAPLASYLEQRVADELAAEGTPLSGRGVELEVEQIGERLLISLVDLATRRALASTKLDEIPADREAAVASVTQLAATLVHQIDGQTPPPPAMSETTAATVVEMLAEDRETQRQHDLEARRQRKVEIAYDEQALTLGDEYAMFATTTTRPGTRITDLHFGSIRRWQVYQGRERSKLSGAEFYRTIGRDDLADAYNGRKRREWIAVGAGVVLMGTGLYLALGPGRPRIVDKDSIPSCQGTSQFSPVCDADAFEEQRRLDSTADTYRHAAYYAIGGGVIAGLIATWYGFNPHPISEREAAALAREYNGALRNRLDRTVKLGDAVLHDVRITPDVTGDGGGLVLSGRF